jgi:hypothetical protein
MRAASSGSGMPPQAADQVRGLVNVTRLPWPGPWQSSPRQASGLRTAAHPERRCSARRGAASASLHLRHQVLSAERASLEHFTGDLSQRFDLGGRDEGLLP